MIIKGKNNDMDLVDRNLIGDLVDVHGNVHYEDIKNMPSEVDIIHCYVNNNIKLIGIGDNVGIDIPKPIASINFDALHAGTYVVDVKQDGSYSAVFVGSMGVYE